MAFDLSGFAAGAGGFQGGYEQARQRRRAISVQEQQMRDAAARAALERQRVAQDAAQFDASLAQRGEEFKATREQSDRESRAGAVVAFGERVRKNPENPTYWQTEADALEEQYPGIGADLIYPGKKLGTGGSITRENADGTTTVIGDMDTVAPPLAPTAEQLATKARLDSQRAGDILAQTKAERDAQQGAVGLPSRTQNDTGRNINAARAALGLPPLPVPFDPSGQVRSVTSSAVDLSDPSKIPPMDEFLARAMGGATPPTLPTKTTDKQFPILNPGYEPDAETQNRQAQTKNLTESARAKAMEVALMPAKLQLEYKKLMQTGQYQQAQLMLTKYNAEAGRAVTIRGQNLSADTAAQNRAATDSRHSDDLQFRGEEAATKTGEAKRQSAWKSIEAATEKRDEAWNGANYYRRLIDQNVDADGKELTAEKKKTYTALAMQGKAVGQFHQNAINAKKKALGVSPQPRDKPTGRFTTRKPSGGKVITTKSGRKLTVR